MALDFARARKLLQSFDLAKLFVEELGWDRHASQLTLEIDDATYRLVAVAQKRGMVAYVCQPGAGASLPVYATRRRIERVVSKTHFEHLIIFTDSGKTTQLWQWIKREPGRPAAPREHAWHRSQPGDALLQKLQAIVFTLDEEESITGIDVASRIRAGFDVERVTRRFYERFKAEHDGFAKFIRGIPHDDMHRWYVSVMLNRLMFIYFVQKKGFLNNDPEYLRTKLSEFKRAGKDRFYQQFLCPLFFDGFATRESERSEKMKKLLGSVPYLNGGLFWKHQIEELHGKTIEIPDAAFEKLFVFFDAYQWHLDERPLRQDDEINPDVLGYIFEKYINQKQMGAYYTKEDITEYIAKNTIIPFLFDAAARECPIALKPDAYAWQLLRDDPVRYIYASVRKGVIDEAGQVLPLPPEIEAGIADIPKRTGWNKAALEAYALPTETWREHVARRQRCLELRRKLKEGEVTKINDLITLNLDIRQFAQDVIVNAEGSDLVRAFYGAIEKVSVLDPTCGSGAFLFAALNVLEPLYEGCLDRMQEIVDDTPATSSARRAKWFDDMKAVLARVASHPNRRHFVFKSIIVHNLYGVDLMEEAVEICKLRLFLKLVAQVDRVEQVEPLPDIDFNIRAGNTLVGFASFDQVKKALEFGSLDFEGKAAQIDASAANADRLFRKFRDAQLATGSGTSSALARTSKKAFADALGKLAADLDGYLATEHGHVGKGKLDAFRESHHPFHWFVEFYGILKDAGFDVIIGNPPYVATSKVDYLSTPQKALRLPDLYAHVLLRSLALSHTRSRLGMIVPLSLTFSEDFGTLRKALIEAGNAWFSSFDNIPAALFAGVSQRCTIWIGDRGSPTTHVSPMYRWRSITRQYLVDNIAYANPAVGNVADGGIPKLGLGRASEVLTRVTTTAIAGGRQFVVPSRQGRHWIRFSQTARNFVSAFKEDPPYLEEHTLKTVPSSKIGDVAVATPNDVYASLAALTGELYFWYWLTLGDGFDVTGWIISDFLAALGKLPSEHCELLTRLGQRHHERRYEALAFKKNAGKYVGNFNYRGHSWLTRRADLVLLAGLGADRSAAIEIFEHVQRVLAINEFAGERSIPDAVKAKYRPKRVDEEAEKLVLDDADRLIRKHFGFTPAELKFLYHEDVTYGRDGEDD